MIGFRMAKDGEAPLAMEIIDMAKEYLKGQGIDQWQNGYPDLSCLENDIRSGKGYFITEQDDVIGYLCIDFDGEPAYETLKGSWNTEKPYVVVHRMAVSNRARKKGVGRTVFALAEELAREKGVRSFRVDTDADNKIMQAILDKQGFRYCGVIRFDNSEKIAFDKRL